MAWIESTSTRDPQSQVLDRLAAICRSRGLADLGTRLGELARLVGDDMAMLERDVATVCAEPHRDAVERSAAHLLSSPGKRLRPMCVVLAARVGRGLDARGRELAIAAELVHAATLLHDDVIDAGELRRGVPAARTMWGNAASIFAGDWLLVDALRRVRRAGHLDVLDRLLGAIDEMIRAEAVQLARRGRIDTNEAGWLRVVEGKTAALFRWAMFAGARAGGLGSHESVALEAYGTDLGVAFQAIDDVLDLTGESASIGKALFADLREGKMTWPLIVAARRDPAVHADLSKILVAGEEESAGAPHATTEAERARVLAALASTGAVRDGVRFARERAARAVSHLSILPPGPAVDALATVAEAAVAREA